MLKDILHRRMLQRSHHNSTFDNKGLDRNRPHNRIKGINLRLYRDSKIQERLLINMAIYFQLSIFLIRIYVNVWVPMRWDIKAIHEQDMVMIRISNVMDVEIRDS